ncbi:hypothetical protein [Streptomyces avermitilis]|uniref:hypothetical protein n=1 Tax=Streptomyces avermitilis TaxID=33903 RepID=UPI00369BF547
MRADLTSSSHRCHSGGGIPPGRHWWLGVVHRSEGLVMSRFQVRKRVRHFVSTGAGRAKGFMRSKARAVDIWVQDHTKLVITSMMLTLFVGTGTLLYFRWDEVIDLAKQLAPVFTILSIVASLLLAMIKWFDMRRARRLAEEQEDEDGNAPETPREEDEGGETPDAPREPSES